MENEQIDVIITHPEIPSVRNIVLIRLILLLMMSILLGSSCSRDIPAEPMCRTADLYSESAPSAAACLIKSNGRLLAITQQKSDSWTLPFHKQHQAISAQCTAHKAVWKTTGLNVEVGELLFTSKSQTQFFACKLTDDYSKQLTDFPVPPWARRATTKIALIDPFNTQQHQWVDELDVIQIRQGFNQL